MRVLLFRPEADARRSAELLREHGHEPIPAPLFRIVAGDEPAPDGPFDALVLTSGNAVPAPVEKADFFYKVTGKCDYSQRPIGISLTK